MTNTNRNKKTTNHLKWLAPLLGVALIVWACGFMISGINQWRAAAAEAAVKHARDELESTVTQTLENLTGKILRQMELPAVKAALAENDTATAAAAIAKDWADVEQANIWPEKLDAAYADLAGFGYARLALLEGVLKDQEPHVAVVRIGETVRLAIAAPASYGSQGRGVVCVQLPMQQLIGAMDAVERPDDMGVALKKDGYTVVMIGPQSPRESASALRAIGKTGFQMAIYSPAAPYRPFEAGFWGSLVIAIILLGLSIVAFRLPKWLGNLNRRRHTAYDEVDLTLTQAVRHDAPSVASVPHTAAQSAKTDSVVQNAKTDSAAVPETVPAPSTKKVDVDPAIFSAYDIRGIVKHGLTPEIATLIGQAIGSVMQEQGLNDIVVGRDGRLSGPELTEALIDGLWRAGRNVIDIGLVPTPVLYFATYYLRAGSGVMVTGSHNPPEYNGFKIVIGGEALYGEDIRSLGQRIRDGRLHRATEPKGIRQATVTEDYVQRIADDVQLQRPLKVVLDAGNGAAGEIAPQVLEAIGATVIPLHCDIDGTFPNHHPDPSDPGNLVDLIKSVEQFDADLGLALDGDGDRLWVVDKKGNIIFPDRLLMLFAEDMLLRNPGAMVIYDVKSTNKLSNYILQQGGSPLMWKTGHSLIKAKMRETGAELAGEMSGHFFFGERWYGFDDGLYSAARLLEILSTREESPSEVLGALPSGIMTPEIKVAVDGEDPHAVAARVVEMAQGGNALFTGANLTVIDGLRADWPDGWGLLRASNTMPTLVFRFEADTAEAMSRIKRIFHDALRQAAPDLSLDF